MALGQDWRLTDIRRIVAEELGVTTEAAAWLGVWGTNPGRVAQVQYVPTGRLGTQCAVVTVYRDGSWEVA